MVSHIRELAAIARGRAREERGQVLLLFAAGLVAFCGFVGMSIDVGRVVYTRTDLQKIADAAALAGSQDLPGSPGNAAHSANVFAADNGGSLASVTFGASNATITVSAAKHVDYVFLRVLGLDGRDVSATATAKATQQTVTGYKWDNVAPFIIWGGSRKNVKKADEDCPLYVCVDSSYSFLDNQWMKASGIPSEPDWTASDSNNFKGDINHGDGAPVSNIGDTFTDGGLGSVEPPKIGDIVVIPIVDKASGGSDLRRFHIAAWAVVKVDSSCNKQACSGTIQSADKEPPPGWVGGGSVPPPDGLDYKGTETSLIS